MSSRGDRGALPEWSAGTEGPDSQSQSLSRARRRPRVSADIPPGASCFLTFSPGASGGAVLPSLNGSPPLTSLDFDVTPRERLPLPTEPPGSRRLSAGGDPSSDRPVRGGLLRSGGWGVATVTLQGHSPALVGSGGLLKSARALLRALPAHTHGSKGRCWLCSAASWLLLPGGRPMCGVWKHVDPGWSPGWVTRLRAQCLCSCLASVSAREMGWRRLPGPSGVGWGQGSTVLRGHPPFWAGTSPWDPCISSPSPQALLGGGGGGGLGWRQQVLGARPTQGPARLKLSARKERPAGSRDCRPSPDGPVRPVPRARGAPPSIDSTTRRGGLGQRGSSELCVQASLGGHPPNLPHTSNLVLMDKISLRILMRLLLETDSSSED